jgi:hypothetical protein
LGQATTWRNFLLSRANHAPPATQVRRNAHSTQQISSMQQRSTEMWRTSNHCTLLAGPVAVPAGSATITATRRSQRRQSRPTWRDTNPQQDAGALPSTTEQQTWLLKPARASHRRTSQPGTSYMRLVPRYTEAELEHGRGDGRPTARAPRATHTPEGNGTTQVCTIKLKHSARNAEVTPNRPHPSRHSPRDGAPDHQPHARARQETKARRGRGRKREINGAA